MGLMRDGLWELVIGEEVEPADDGEMKVLFKARRNKALSTIVLSVEPNLLYLLGNPVDPRIVWNRLAGEFQKKSWSNKLDLKRKLFLLRLTGDGDVQEHIKTMTEILDELSAIDEPVTENDRVVHLLTSLPESFDMLVTALQANDDVPRWEMVTEKIRQEERRQKIRAERTPGKEEEEALAARNTKGPRCYQCGKLGHIRRNCGESTNRARSPPREYRRRSSPRDNRRGSTPRDSRRGAYCTTYESDESSSEDGVGLLVAQAHATTVSNQGTWIVDSGATSHMGNNRRQFRKFRSLCRELEVTLGDGHVLKATGKGDVKLEMTASQGRIKCILRDVLYVPGLAHNLFSVSKATEAGKTTNFTKEGCSIREVNGNRLIAEGYRQGGLYYLGHDDVCTQAHVASTETWHRRFGHLGSQNLTRLERHNMVKGLRMTSGSGEATSVCEPCLEGKQHLTPFTDKSSRARGILDLVHSDVCGKTGHRSLSGAEYFVTFIDSHSNRTWAYVLKKKSEVFSVFRKWKALVENETGRSVKTLRTDNGGEYTSKEFQGYLQTHGIRHERTIPKTPQQNGKAERMNRTLLESVRSMLGDSKLPKRFWAEALTTAVYLRNRSPTSSLPETTPMEVWTGKKPDVSHLRVFGCSAYAHIPRDERGKLDSKTRKCWMMGYGTTTKGYRLYDQNRSRVFYSRDVQFNEQGTGSQEELTSDSEPEEPGGHRKYPVEHGIVQEGEDVAPDDGSPPRRDERVRRSERVRRKPGAPGASEWASLASAEDPRSFPDALASPKSREWRQAMRNEMDSLSTNRVWTLTDLPTGKKAVGSRWVFKTKMGADGSIARYKARLVARGFSQIPGSDYDETFSPVVRGESIRALFALAAKERMCVHQMDVETAFLNGILLEEVYMQQPEGYEEKGKEQQVCRLHRSIYGLKQSPRCWNDALDAQLRRLGFTQTPRDPCLYVSDAHSEMIVAVYVDDLMVAGKNIDQIQETKTKLSKEFRMKDLGRIHQFLGIRVIQDLAEENIWIGQANYILKLLTKFGMQDSHPVSTPSDTDSKLTKKTAEDEAADQQVYQAAVGSLLYLSTKTRPDISFAVGSAARFSSDPSQAHWRAVKRIMRYLRGTVDLGLLYHGGSGPDQCIGYSDADWGGSRDDRKSTSGYVFTWSGGAISWRSRKQSCVALSTAESEYVALSGATQEAKWIAELIGDLTAQSPQKMTILEDNQSAISIAKNPQYHGRTKHIDIKFHFVRSQVENGNIELEYCPSKDMVADILTKSLPTPLFEKLRGMMGVQPDRWSSRRSVGDIQTP